MTPAAAGGEPGSSRLRHMVLAIAALLAASSTAAARSTVQASPPEPATPHQEQGQEQEQEPKPELEWFEGTFEELMSEARASRKLVFLDFWAEW